MDLNKTYVNGQAISALTGDTLTIFFKTGIVKAQGTYKKDLMEGEWVFNRDSGMLWQVGDFLHGEKHGLRTRFDKKGILEYKAEFAHNKLIKKLK